MTKEELKVILDKHILWLCDKEGGVRANLGYANLQYANLEYATLKGANLKNADLYGATMPEGFKGETE